MSLNLLTESLIRTDRDWHTLPGLLAALARGEVASFPAMRPHQRPAWHMFLVQLATLALAGAGRCDLSEDEETWCILLRGLTPEFDDDALWHLVVEDREKPGFLQPPDPGGLKWSPVETPDALDMLITARNHDLKQVVARAAAPQDWMFALVSLQTMEGYGGGGGGYRGIARMNGGSSSRPMLALAPSVDEGQAVDPSAWWRRDVETLAREREGLRGPALVWTLPWPEGRSLDLGSLDPLFIEVCRRVRVLDEAGRLSAIRSSSKASRIEAREAKGNTGDPWAPVDRTDGRAWTLSDRDWTYKNLAMLLYGGDWQVPRLARHRADEADRPMLLIAEAFARGNSRTDGFKSRVIPVPKVVVRQMLGTRPVELSKDLMERIRGVDRALRDGLAVVAAEGATDRLESHHYARARSARDALDRHADAIFFPTLWAQLAAETEAERDRIADDFLGELARAARDEFAAALPAIPCARIMRPRAEARGRAMIDRRLAALLQETGATQNEHV